MSRNEWERGELKMSVKEFGSVRRDMVAFCNERQAQLFERAKTIYQTLKTSGKGKRNFDFLSAYDAILNSNNHNDADADGYDEIYRSLFINVQVNELIAGQPMKVWRQSKKPKAPKKSHFAPLKQSVERIDIGGEASIGFKKDTRTIIWNVEENNHSVDRARNSAIGRAFFKRLARVEWTRGTGGQIIGNDEYNEDSGRDYAGGGGSYVTARFGIAEKEFKKSLGGIR